MLREADIAELKSHLENIKPNQENLLLSNVSEFTRFLAFYLPQFHPIPENDAWWGKGFTEWRSVTKTTPRFTGHYQPRLPTELGFYDLRVAETREEQAALAHEYGINGFVYYHYWFHGKRLLDRPINEVLAEKKPDFPFCFCWANETWSNNWGPTYGSKPNEWKKEVLIEQKYSDQDDADHIKWLVPIFNDDRYIRVNNKPLFIVYRPSLLPNPQQTTDLWRAEAYRNGIPDLQLVMAQTFTDDQVDPTAIGFDAALEIQPDPRKRLPVTLSGGEGTNEKIFSYRSAVEMSLQQEKSPYQKYQSLFPNWDNSARRSEGATIFVESTPELYQLWLLNLMLNVAETGEKDNLIFINSWNEWAEGSQLEPDSKWGRGYLEAHREALLLFALINIKNKG